MKTMKLLSKLSNLKTQFLMTNDKMEAKLRKKFRSWTLPLISSSLEYLADRLMCRTYGNV